MAEPRPGAPPPARAPTGALLSVVSAVVLLLSMFGLQWYGVVRLPSGEKPGTQSAAGAWTVLTDLRWLMLVTALVAIGAVVLHVSQRSHGSQTNTGPVVACLGAVTAVLLFVRVMVDLPNSPSIVDAKLGAYIGLLAAVGIALGGFESMREQRVRRTRMTARARQRPDLATNRPAR